MQALKLELDRTHGGGQKRSERDPEAVHRCHHPTSRHHLVRSPRSVGIDSPQQPARTIGPDRQPVLGTDRSDRPRERPDQRMGDDRGPEGHRGRMTRRAIDIA